MVSSPSSSSSSSAASVPSPTYFLRRHVSDDDGSLTRAYRVIERCGVAMTKDLGLSHWDPPYPISVLLEYAKTYEVYGVYRSSSVEEDTEPVATFTLGLSNFTKYFHDGLWPSHPIPSKPAYMGKLAVDPTLQSRGLGRWCMQAFESLAREKGANCVRFDAVSTHPFLHKFYTSCGYVETSRVFSLSVHGVPLELTCFEKVLIGSPGASETITE
jgi:GNAT superfamily N-acetyltransferase